MYGIKFQGLAIKCLMFLTFILTFSSQLQCAAEEEISLDRWSKALGNTYRANSSFLTVPLYDTPSVKSGVREIKPNDQPFTVVDILIKKTVYDSFLAVRSPSFEGNKYLMCYDYDRFLHSYYAEPVLVLVSEASEEERNNLKRQTEDSIRKRGHEREARIARIQNDPNYRLVPGNFDTNVEWLPKSFKGDDVSGVWQRYKKIPAKGEFETTQQYLEKTGGVAKHIYAFAISGTFSYEPESSQLKSALSPSNYMAPINLYDNAFIEIYQKDKPAKSYIGSNAFGVKRQITAKSGVIYGLSISNMSKTQTFSKYNPLNSKVSMPPEAAKEAKPFLKFLVICSPEPDKGSFVFESKYYNKATIDNPVELWYDLRILRVRLKEIWIVNIKTGNIILKEQLD